MEEMWVCKQCGHFVLYDGCGFLFSDGQVQNCENCPQDVPETSAILNAAEMEKEHA